MRQAVIDVDPDLLAERGLQFDVFREAGVVDTEVLSCEGSRGVLRVHVEERLDPGRLDAMDAVEWWEPVSSEGSTFVYLLEADAAGPRDAAAADGDAAPAGSDARPADGDALPADRDDAPPGDDAPTDGDATPPDPAAASADDGRFPRCERLRVTDEGLTLTWVAPEERLHEGLAAIDAAGGEVTLRMLRGYRAGAEPLDALTDRQREVLEAAYERGYYDVPRAASVAEVAAALDLDDSTVAEHLQRAERNLLGALLDGGP